MSVGLNTTAGAAPGAGTGAGSLDAPMRAALLRRRLLKAGILGAVALVVVFSLFPFYWAVVSSLKEGSDLFKVEYWPSSPTLANYRGVLTEPLFLKSLGNSVFVAVVTALISHAVALLAAYPLARSRFRGRSALLLGVLGVSMFPQVAVLSGMFELVRAFGLYNQLWGLVLSYQLLVLPFTVWVLVSFMREIPKELEEAALLDGCSPTRILFQVFLPIMAPATITTGLLGFISAWNEFLFALTFTLTPEKRTVPVAISMLSGSSQYELPWGTLMAASVIVTVPVILLVVAFQRRIVSGLTAGAVKG